MISKLIFATVLITLLTPALFPGTRAQEVKLYPVDEATHDPSFKRFRDKLIVAVKKRDRKFLLNILHPEIINSFGGDGRIPEFVTMWKLNSPDSKVWAELLTVLSMGGSFGNDRGRKIFEAPYVSSSWERIEKKLPGQYGDVFYAAIVKQNVRVHSRPDAQAPVVIVLSYDVVEIDYEGSVEENAEESTNRWVKIKTLKGIQGYVRGSEARTPTDFSAGFKKVRGKWLMYFFVAGD
ncbi:MAG: SH3 domain-containing protein [Pyrinomonadaceae bacterium]